ncbi:dual specificity protein kinase kns1, partial [Kickxella alabastrina]
MSAVLSFVTSLFRSRNNNHMDSHHDIVGSKPPRFRSTPDLPLPLSNNIARKQFVDNRRTLSKQNIKSTMKPSSNNNPFYDQPNQMRRIFSSSKMNSRSVAVKNRNANVNTFSSSVLRRPQQKAEPSCDDRDGHYIVVPGRDFTQRFKIRRLLGQGTFGKVME